MNEKSKLLSVVTELTGDVVYIHATLDGLKELRKSIDFLIQKTENNQCDHEHLRSKDWAGFELTTSMLAGENKKGCKQVHHLKFYGWNEEFKAKHNL